MEPFKYRALETPDTIRVINIRPTSGLEAPARIVCDIEHIRIGRADYSALSYEWGPATAGDNDTTIYMNGSVTAIRRNLFHALSHMRYSFGEQRIWIDALCINQSDTLERNDQVRLMGSIYRGATLVLIWPGKTEDFLGDHDATLVVERSRAKKMMVRRLVEELCKRPYWKRVWIQQEVFLARSLFIMHGRYRLLRFGDFDSQVALSMHRKNPFPRGVAAKIRGSAASAIVMRKHVGSSLSPLATWLRMACEKDLQTSEPRDLIYGMLAISSDCQDGGIEPDYDKPLIDVYLETVLFCGLHQPGQEFPKQRFLKTLAGKLGLSWDSDMETRMQEYRQQKVIVQPED